jgi:hypothetical protein
MKKIKILGLMSIMLFLSSFSVSALNNKVSRRVQTLNSTTGSSFFNFTLSETTGEIIIYEDKVNGFVVGISIERMSQPSTVINSDSGSGFISPMGAWIIDNGTWSSGTLPEGTFTLRPWIQNLSSGQEVSFKVDVVNDGSTITFGNIRNSIIFLGEAYVYSTITRTIVQYTATPTKPALAQLTFKTALSLFPNDWKDAYLKIEINTNGQSRVSWKYYFESIF